MTQQDEVGPSEPGRPCNAAKPRSARPNVAARIGALLTINGTLAMIGAQEYPELGTIALLLLAQGFVFGIIGVTRMGRARFGWDMIFAIMSPALPFYVGQFAFICVAGERQRRAACASNLDKIGEAVEGYVADYADFPYDPRGPLHSLALLYPKYLDDPAVFSCPSGCETEREAFPSGSSLAGTPCSYGYAQGVTMEISEQRETPIVADLIRNHAYEGINVLYASYDTRWRSGQFILDEWLHANEPVTPEGMHLRLRQ